MTIKDSVFVYRLAGGDRLSWHGRYHAHEGSEFELHFFTEGEGAFLCNRTKYPVSAGQLFLTGPRDFHSIVPDSPNTPLTYYAILFSLDDAESSPDHALAEALRAAIERRETVLSISSDFRFQFEDCLQMARSADTSLRASAEHLVASFLFRWFARPGAHGAAQDTARPDGKNRAHVERALALMTKSVRENLRVEEIAWKLGLSSEHFIRVFRDEVRMTPHQYYTRLKVEGASGLLMSTDKTVGEIADWFGFENQFHFSRIFKKCTGLSPLEYRRCYIQTVDFT
jgi:transcriptional regulator GlxA family with amidase domain